MVVLLDGGFSSQLQKYIDEKAILDHPLWCAGFLSSNPDDVIKVHYDYIRAGCDVIITNTYQSSVDGFKKYLNLNHDDSIALIKQAVYLARQAVDKSKPCKVQVAGSVGPYGACLHDGSEYRGDYVERLSQDQLIAWHRPRVAALVSAGVDLLAIETIPALDEAIALFHLLKDEFPQQKFWISFSCKNGSHISHGELFSDVVNQCCKVAGPQLVAVGVNCVAPPMVTPLLTSAQGLPVPFIVYPNGGGVWNPGVGWMDKESCSPLASYISEWVSLGAHFVGGCCGSTAEDIQLCRKQIDSNISK